jgi:hypothetical protein
VIGSFFCPFAIQRLYKAYTLAEANQNLAMVGIVGIVVLKYVRRNLHYFAGSTDKRGFQIL